MKTFKEILSESKEELVKPTTKKFGFHQDNPGGEWLQYEREKAQKGYLGSVTGSFKDIFLLPTKMLINLKGKHGEKRKLSSERVQTLLQSIKKYGIHEPIFINVEYDGTAVISEGNRRTLIAKTLGLKEVPVEVRYYSGGERVKSSDWFPDKLVKKAKNWNRPKNRLEDILPKPKLKPIQKPKPKQNKTEYKPDLSKETKDTLKLLKQLGMIK